MTKNFYVLWVGRFVPVKGLNILVEAALGITNKYKNIHFTLIGEGIEKKAINKLIESKKLQKYFSIEKAKFSKDLIKAYKSADVFVLPSIASEGFPITVVEALAAKLPVIASDIGDTDQLVKNGITGYLVKPGSVSDLEEKILKILNKSDRYKLGVNGYNLVKKKYTWDIISKQIYDIYTKLLS